MIKKFLTKLQAKPYETRVKILWGTVIVIGILLIMFWVSDLKGTIKGIDTSNLVDLNPSDQNTVLTKTPFAAVERVELSGTLMKIYFNFTNSSDDILNVSKLNDVSLNINDTSLTPQKMTDRQNAQFVQKVLSHSQSFGILTFEAAAAKTATLTFDQMFFEKAASDILQQKLELDLEQLTKSEKIRN
ncbi:MAG: hypothetical protein A2660_00525 [Candidatus Doudnabacteria bacterium RIFCSPHIGHO2_01_FULL_45_18]|uniref:Uncharacterized protein n=1 Tax=Candidatus Doudnabacteria bacterium RIFCSPHIGHO2_01_FULL_45_18 TaxID=1817823 RepID=A0A1F5NQZ0_9BACT|nr:MAG: hypothetical protein A2660_00525 [Candidatus Doudnabacteria bacterium RIFCSPHIGHO2_01_FULL_45_18]